MRVPHFLLFTLGLSASLALFGCSRESSVKENVNLKNNHSRVFIFDSPIVDPTAFADSMANVAVAEGDTIPDTLTVTVNDTVYMIGLLPYNVDKIFRFQWTLTKKDGKDTTIIGGNAKPQAWAYAKPGLYEPKFVAFDGNNATDTAGTATRKAWVKVIDTKPTLIVPKDTLWTKHDGDITFPILASDSFGTITSIKVDLDASGKKESAKNWKYEKFDDNDSLYLTIKNKEAKIDSLGNQKIYVIVVDDDGNETKDSVNLHFNRIPRLKVIYPQDGARHNINDRFYFYYEGEDDDNPQNLQYFIYAQVSKNGQPPQKAFTEEDLIAKAFTSNIFEPIDKKGKNVITLISDPSKQLTGRIYWDMYATDGYDIVRLTRISTGDNSSRPWNFYIGDLSSSQGTFTGTAKYQGRDSHSGIRVEFNNGNKTFDVTTDEKGNYTVKVDAGNYTATAISDSLKEYADSTIKNLYAESGSVIRMDEIVLKDTAKPYLIVKNIDTLTNRELSQTIYARDLGSRLDSVTAAIDGKSQKLNCTKSDNDAIFNCPLALNNLTDGNHTFEYSAKDKVGNKSTIKQNIIVKATQLNLTVNGFQNARIGKDEELEFIVKVIGAYPAAKNVTWSWNIGNGEKTNKMAVGEDGSAKLTLSYDDIKSAGPDKDFFMTVTYKENGADVSTQVKFGTLGDNPAVVFTEPGFENTVSINDPLHFKVLTYKGNKSETITLKWICENLTNLSAGYTCPTTEEADLAFSKVGTYKVAVKVTDNLNNSGSDTVVVNVVADPPSINVSTKNKSNEYKIGSSVDVDYNAKDKFGTINQIKWGCNNGNVIFDHNKTFDSPAASVSGSIKVEFPGGQDVKDRTEHTCIFKAIDDDNEEASDTISFILLRDPPTVRLATKKDTVKINSEQTIKAIATDKLGYIAEYAYACSENKSDLKNPNWSIMGGSETKVRMPSTAVKEYYCVVQVTDDDGNTARDTAQYTILLGLPTVTAYVNYSRVTINDEVELNAHAQDSLGQLVKYEWGCGSASAENIGFTYSSTSTPRKTMKMPATAQNGYKCIVRVTDDDGNTAKDTVSIDIIQAPPTVTVANKELTVRANFNIALKATASDDNKLPSDPGEIVKREWSCGSNSQVENNWKKVSSLDTVWKAPAVQQLICIAQVTDNDGNTARDTITIKYTTEIPMLWADADSIYVNPGDPFTLNASVNDAWQGIDWFSWECVDAATGKTMEKKVTQYDYEANGKSFAIGKDSSYSEQGKNMYCIISARETSGKDVLKDTTKVKILKQHPKGVITAADTVYLWSGDESVDDQAIYYYTSEWGGFHSEKGELGDPNKQDYWWKFSNVDGNFYQGNTDGTLDTNIAEFNTAFIRRTREGSVTITLDYRDSTTTSPSNAFYSRHRAPEYSHKVYFSKAWKNQGKDTVIEKTSSTIAPSFAIVNQVPTIAYATNDSKVTVAKLNGNSWTSLGSIEVTGNIKKIGAIAHGNNFYVGILADDLSIYKSTSGTSAPAKVSSPSLTGIKDFKLVGKDSEPAPHAVIIGSDDKIYMYDNSGSSWTKNSKFGSIDSKFTEVDAIYTDDGYLIVAGVNSSYRVHIGYFSKNDYSSIEKKQFDVSDIGRAKITSSGKKIYMVYFSRGVETYGPRIATGSINSNNISWEQTGAVIREGIFTNNINLVARNGVVYAAFDNRAQISQVDVYRYENGKWHLYGENLLPYFNAVFYTLRGYYLRGIAPSLVFDNEGKLYVSMLAQEGSGGPKRNNGPLVMKYVADNWKVHDNKD